MNESRVSAVGHIQCVVGLRVDQYNVITIILYHHVCWWLLKIARDAFATHNEPVAVPASAIVFVVDNENAIDPTCMALEHISTEK